MEWWHSKVKKHTITQDHGPMYGEDAQKNWYTDGYGTYWIEHHCSCGKIWDHVVWELTEEVR